MNASALSGPKMAWPAREIGKGPNLLDSKYQAGVGRALGEKERAWTYWRRAFMQSAAEGLMPSFCSGSLNFNQQLASIPPLN